MTEASASNDFKTRLLSALVLAPIVILLAWLGGIWFAALMVVIAATMYWEWTTITVRSIDIRRDVIAGISILGLIFTIVTTPSIAPIMLAFGLIIIGAGVVLLINQKIGWNIAGVGVASSLALCLIYIRNASDSDTGLYLLVFLCFCVWSADIFAYLVGRAIGGPKLMPKVSPKKTWSGFLGGIIGAIVTGGLIALMTAPDKIITLSLVALIIALTAQVGDLIESAIKRHFNVKDASNLIPGHGGVLDRVDGLTFAAYAFVLIYAIGIFD